MTVSQIPNYVAPGQVLLFLKRFICSVVLILCPGKRNISLVVTYGAMGNKKRNNSLPHSQWATRSETFRLHSRNICYFCVDVHARSETTRFHTANGQQEAKRFASIPAIYAIFVLTCMQEAKQLASTQPMGNKKRNVSLPFPQYILFLC
jgi:hypothetical protein